MNQVETVRPHDFGLGPRQVEQFLAAAGARADRGRHARAAPAPRRADPRRRFRRRRPVRRQPGDDPRPVPQVRRGRGPPVRAWLARARRADPAGGDRAPGRARRVRPHHPRGVRRLRPLQGGDVRRHRGAEPRLYRRGLARHPQRDRGRADPARRHRRAEGPLPAQDRLGRDHPDRRVHRAQHRLGPRLAHHPRRAQGRPLGWSPAPRTGSPTPPAPT